MNPTQEFLVLKHLESGKPLTAREAMIEYGIQQLPVRIFHLREAGYAIETEMKPGVSRYGDRIHYAEYRLAS